MDEIMKLDYDKINVGDTIQVVIGGSGHLSGRYLKGMVVEKNEKHRMIKLHTGWCCHETDDLILHEKVLYG